MTKSTDKGSSNGSRTKHYPQNKVFEGSHPEMKGYYYTHNPDHQAVDQYQQTSEKLIEIVCSSFKEPQLLKLCLKELSAQSITKPTLGENGPVATDGTTSSTRQDELEFNNQFKEWQTRERYLKESLHNTFNVIHGQCNRAMKAKIEEDPQWETGTATPLGY
jgi:hypothetical protein